MPVVARHVELHHLLDANQPVSLQHHARLRRGDRQDRPGPRRQDRVEGVGAKHAEVSDREGARVVLVGAELLLQRAFHKVLPISGNRVNVGRLRVLKHGRDEAAIGQRHRIGNIDVLVVDDRVVFEARIDDRMALEHDRHSLGKKRRYRHTFGLHLLVKLVQRGRLDLVCDAEDRNGQRSVHVLHNSLLEAVHRDRTLRDGGRGLLCRARCGARRRGRSRGLLLDPFAGLDENVLGDDTTKVA
mmetsp:Transcript_14451/g.36932  ORF Transcript_14451/g.36932 Transcript_14451/m.36932 type:complete len:243 (+) Transcript_14451:217-945(+)